MNAANPPLDNTSPLSINWADRWAVYHRLQSLEIPCHCQSNQPLSVEIPTPLAAFQVWNVVRQITASRQELVGWLDDCWQIQ